MIDVYMVLWLGSLALAAVSYGGGALYVLLSSYHYQNFRPFLYTFFADFILHFTILLDVTGATLSRAQLLTLEQGQAVCRYNFFLTALTHILTPFVYFRLTFNIIFREYRAMLRFSKFLIYTTMATSMIVIVILWSMGKIACNNCDTTDIAKQILTISNVAETFHLILLILAFIFLEFDGTDKVSLLLVFCAIALELPANTIFASKALEIYRLRLRPGSFSLYLDFLLVHVFPLAYPGLFVLMTREYRERMAKKIGGHANLAMDETCLECAHTE